MSLASRQAQWRRDAIRKLNRDDELEDLRDENSKLRAQLEAVGRFVPPRNWRQVVERNARAVEAKVRATMAAYGGGE